MGRYLHLQGRVYYALRDPVTGAPGVRRFLGNARSCSIETETEIIEHLESTTGLRIMDNRYQFGLKVNATLEFDEYDKRNLALATKGTFVDHSSGTGVSDTTPTLTSAAAYNGTFFRTRFGSISNVVVTDGSSATLTAGTNYRVVDARSGRIEFISVGSFDPPFTVTYDHAAQSRIPALNDTTPPELWLELDGINVAAQSKRLNVTIYRFAFNATESLMLLNDDPTMLTLSGAVLREDAYASGSDFTTFGQYFNVLEVE